MQRRKFMLSLGVGMVSLSVPGCVGKRKAKWPQKKPNIIFIMSDDHAAQALSCYGSKINQTPNLDRIAREGMRFDQCFCTNGICAPSRAVILTGKHSHLNGVLDNRMVFDGDQPTFPKLLQQAGYQTAMIGKWHLKSDPTGFDYWNVLPGQGHYYNPDLIEMGVKTRHSGYVTDIITDIAIDFMKNKRSQEKPFLLMFHHKAPHRNWQPAPRHLQMYDNEIFPEPETLFDDYSSRSQAAYEQEMTLRDHMQDEYDLKMGPPPERLNEQQVEAWEAAYAPKRKAYAEKKLAGSELVKWKYQRYMQDYLGCIAAVDENMGRILDFLKEMNLDGETVVIYTSDQGFYLGEHGWFDKRFMYEESLRMPLLVRFPGGIEAGSVNANMVSNLDFAPTLLELAGVTIPPDMQGRSFKKLLQAAKVRDWRESIYYHYYEYPAVHMVKRHYGIRTKRYKLMHFYHDIDAWELYDLEKDPRELKNVYQHPDYAGVLPELKSELKRLQALYGDSDELAQKLLQEYLEK